MDAQPSDDQTQSNPLAQARDDLIEKVSVAGWKEAFGEHIQWISHCFKIALLIFSGFCFFYVNQVITEWFTKQYHDEIQDFANIDSLPFSNVTICAQLYANETFIRQNITIPEHIIAKVRNQSGAHSEEEFYRQLTLFLSFISRPRNLDRELMIYFRQALRVNPQTQDYAAFMSAAYPPCQSMLKRCWFDGEEFDCCERAVQSIDDDGICYMLALNFDSDNVVPSDRTMQQSRPGSAGGLTVEASVQVKDSPWLEPDAANGFRIMVDHTPYSALQSVLAAPDRSETFIKVTPSKRVLSRNCADTGQMSMPGGQHAYYDPEGLSCIMRQMNAVPRKYVACEVAGNLHKPNASMSCKPWAVQMMSTEFTGDDLRGRSNTRFALQGLADTASWLKRHIAMLEEDVKKSMSDKARCPAHCRRWTYDSTASFSYLDKSHENSSEKYIYSKIHVYYADFGYRQHEEVKESIYTAFCDFANVVALYWGMSVISFFHVFFYVPRYWIALWRARRERRRVAPADVS